MTKKNTLLPSLPTLSINLFAFRVSHYESLCLGMQLFDPNWRISAPKSAFISLKYDIQYSQCVIGQQIWAKNARSLLFLGRKPNTSIVCNFFAYHGGVLTNKFQLYPRCECRLYKGLALSLTYCTILTFPSTGFARDYFGCWPRRLRGYQVGDNMGRYQIRLEVLPGIRPGPG